MRETPFAFVYSDREGHEDHIDAHAMRRLWVDQGSSGIVFAETAGDGAETLHEVVMNGPNAAEAMAEVMETLLATTSFERIEMPRPQDERIPIQLEFRHPQPHVVTLALRDQVGEPGYQALSRRSHEC